MKKSQKIVSVALASLFVGTMFASCGSSTAKVDFDTIVIKVMDAGFGTDWVYELKSKFETAFASDGYKVKIMKPSRSIEGDTVVREMARGYQDVNVDLYITASINPDKVGDLGDYGVLAEEIYSDVYDMPAISYDGTEESVKISDKLDDAVLPYVVDSSNKMYAFNWVRCSGGMAVNTRKLAKYGLEVPKTTKELFHCYDTIYLGTSEVGNSKATNTYPLTYISGSNGYSLCFLDTMLAQYDKAFHDEFWSFQKDGQNLTDEEIKGLYSNDALLKMLTDAYRTFDNKICAPGSLNQSVDQAQAQIMTDSKKSNSAVFMFNGDWMLNEVKLTYDDVLGDIDFANFPVISALGEKLFGTGTAYNLNEDKADELLSYIISLVDENKSLEEIVSSVKTEKSIELTEADAKAVAEARGVTFSRGVEHVAYVTKNSAKKDIAFKFLRMMASDDFGKTFNVLANGATPYFAQENTTSEYPFVKSASRITSNRYFSFVSMRPTAYRKQFNVLNLMFSSVPHVAEEIVQKSSFSIYDGQGGRSASDISVYAEGARGMVNTESANINTNLATWKKNAGIN